MRKVTDVLIIGAGPCGLGAALGLAAVGSGSWLLVEAAPVAGGLAGSVVDQGGFTWDYGGHVTFSKSSIFLRTMELLLGKEGWNRIERSAWAVIDGNWIKYPVQHHWPRLVARDAVTGQLERQSGTPLNFEEWALAKFGPELTEVFFRPYNEKIWTVPLADLGTQWMNDRVASTTRSGSTGWGPNAQFMYPSSGGTGAPWRRLATLLDGVLGEVKYQSAVASIDLSRKTAYLRDGSEVSFGTVISTIPLDQLTLMIGGIPAELAQSTQRLRRTRVTVLGVGMKGQPPTALPHFTWVYFADRGIPFYRVSQISLYASSNTPTAAHWSLLVECSSPGNKHETPTNSEILTALRRVGLVVTDTDVCDLWRTDLDHGYPVPTTDRDNLVDPVLGWLEERECLSRGRFGDWSYESSGQDQAFDKGLEAALHLTGTDSCTFLTGVHKVIPEDETR